MERLHLNYWTQPCLVPTCTQEAHWNAACLDDGTHFLLCTEHIKCFAVWLAVNGQHLEVLDRPPVIVTKN